MANNILTPSEAAAVLRVDESNAEMLNLLPLVDKYIETATGRAWQDDSTIEDAAKSAARMLLVQWYENPAMVGKVASLTHGLTAALAQLEAIAAKWRDYQISGINGGGYIPLDAAREGDQVVEVVGLWGVSGDQSSDFESVISTDGYIQQTSTDDLSDNGYRVTLISAMDAV